MTPKPPYYITASRVWIGEKPPQTSPDYPRCPRCGGESEISMHRHIDSDGAFHEAVFRCRTCGASYPGDEEVDLNTVVDETIEKLERRAEYLE